MKINYGTGAFVLPTAVLSSLSEASQKDLQVLLCIASNPAMGEDITLFSKTIGFSKTQINKSLKFWVEKGILTEEEGEAIALTTIESSQKPLMSLDYTPAYEAKEISDYLEKHESTKILMNELQQILGRVFNPSEVGILVGMLDYKGISEDYLLLLCSHYAKLDVTNVRTLEKKVNSYLEKDITTVKQLEQELNNELARATFEGQVRKLFSIGTRILSSREEKMLLTWQSYNYGMDIVKLAYEITVDTIGEASLPYASAIIEKWHENKLATVAEIKKFNEENKLNISVSKKSNKQAGLLGNSFDTEDFVKAALERSFAEE